MFEQYSSEAGLSKFMGSAGHDLCIIVRYSVRFNGAMSALFSPTRGLRHGDPLSPYLFLFVADGLSKLIDRKVQMGHMQELKICRAAPGISHLLFADDTLLFFKANSDQAGHVKDVLETYSRCTGQSINPAKCSIMFNEKGQQTVHDEVKQILGVQLAAFEAKYLGLPTPSGRMKGDRFQNLKERLGKRLNDYTECVQVTAWFLRRPHKYYQDLLVGNGKR